MSSDKWDLTRLSAGERAALRRCAGEPMSNCSMQAIAAFYHALTIPCKEYNESKWFSAMCMACLWRESDPSKVQTFAEILQSIYQNKQTSDSMKKRCIAFMDIAYDEDGYLIGKICKLAKVLHAKGTSIMPDFEALADDMVHWNDSERWVQRHWIRTITTDDYKENKEEQNHAD